MTLTQSQQTALEAAILAHMITQSDRLARTAAIFEEEAQFRGGEGVQTGSGGAVLQMAWLGMPFDLMCLDTAILAYLTVHGGRFARTAAAFKDDARFHWGEPVWLDSGLGTMLGKAWAIFLEKHDFNDLKNLFEAIEVGDVAEVQLNVWMGIDVEAQVYSRVSYMDLSCPPLYLAAMKNQLKVLTYFVELGYDKDVVDLGGRTPLMEICGGGLVEIAEYLLDQGCKIDSVSYNGYTALHWAAMTGDLDVAHVLFRYGAKLDIQDNDGETAADVAIRRGHHAFADAVRAEEIRRRDHGFKRDPSTIEGTEEHEVAKRPRVEEPAAVDESDDDDDDDNDDDDDDEADT